MDNPLKITIKKQTGNCNKSIMGFKKGKVVQFVVNHTRNIILSSYENRKMQIHSKYLLNMRYSL